MNARSPGSAATRPRLRETFNRWGAAAERLQDRAELRDRVEQQIRARPLLSIALGAVAGFMLGRLLRD